MNHMKIQNNHPKTNNDQKINSINAELSARFQKYRSSPTSVTALIQVLQQKIKILTLNNSIPIPYCTEFQKSIIQKIKSIPQMNSTHVDYIQALYNKEIQSLQTKTSFGHKVLNLIQERSKIFKDVQIMLVKQKISVNSGDKKPSLNLSYIGQNLSKLRDLSLGIIEHLSLWKSSLNLVGEDGYSKLVLQNISKDVQFFRLTPLRKFLQFSTSQDPLFLHSMKKFWKLELNTNYNSRAIMKLFEVTDSYKKRLLNAEKFMKCYDPNVVIYDYPFEESELEGQNSNHFIRRDKPVKRLAENQEAENSINFPSISQKNIPCSNHSKPQHYSSEPRSNQTSAKKAYELLKPIIDEAKLNKYHLPVNFRNPGENTIQKSSLKFDRPSIDKQQFQRPHQSNTEAIRNFGPNRKNRVMTETQKNDVNDIKDAIIQRYPVGWNDVKDFDNSIEGKHKIYPLDKRRKLKPIFKHSLSQHNQNIGAALEALNSMEDIDQLQLQPSPLKKNEEGNSSKKTIKIPNSMPIKPDLKIKMNNQQFQSMNGQKESQSKENPLKKIYNKMNTKFYQTEDEYEKQNFQMNSEIKKQMELEMIKKKQLQLEKALKRYELEEKKKPKTIHKNSRNDEPPRINQHIRITFKNAKEKSKTSKKMSQGKIQNSMDEDREEQSSYQNQVSQFQSNPYQNVKSDAKSNHLNSPGRQNAIISSPKKKDFSNEREKYESINISGEKSPKSTVRQVGKIKIVPLHRINQKQVSPVSTRSLMKEENFEKEKSQEKKQLSQYSNQKQEVIPVQSQEKSPQKRLVEQSIQTSESFLPSVDQKIKDQSSKGKYDNHNQGELKHIKPQTASPYSQYLNQEINDGDKKRLVISQDIKIVNQKKDQPQIPLTKKQIQGRYQIQSSMQNVQAESPKEKVHPQNNVTNKNLVQMKSDQKHSSISHYESTHGNSPQKAAKQIQINDGPISYYEVQKYHSRLSPRKDQILLSKRSNQKSQLQSIVDSKIDPKSPLTKNISSVKSQQNLKDQGKSAKTEAHLSQIPVGSHEIYEVLEQGRSNENESNMKNIELNKQHSNRASSLLSNRSGKDTHRSSVSKSSSMKLESQTSQAIHANAKKINEPNNFQKQQVQNKDLIKDKKLQTIQENQSYRDVSQQNPTSPQHHALNSSKIVPSLSLEKNPPQILSNDPKNENHSTVNSFKNVKTNKENTQSPNKVESITPFANGHDITNSPQKPLNKPYVAETKSFFREASQQKPLQIVKYPTNASRLSVVAEKGSEYRKNDKLPELSLSEDSSEFDHEQVNIYSKDQIVKKEKIIPVKQTKTSWVNPQTQRHQNTGIKLTQNINKQYESIKQHKLNTNESQEVQSKNNDFQFRLPPENYNIQASQKNNQLQANKNSETISISNFNSSKNLNNPDIKSSSPEINTGFAFQTPQKSLNVANLSSIQSNPDNTKPNFIGNNSTLNLNLPNSNQSISSQDFSRKNTIQQPSPEIPKSPSKPNPNSNTSSTPNKITPSFSNPSPTNSVKNNQKHQNVFDPESYLSNQPFKNPGVSSTINENLTQYSEAKEQINNLTKCVFQSKSLSMSQLSEFFAKYKVHEKIIEEIEKGYFSHRHLNLNLCLLNNEVITIVLSHPAFVRSQRVVYIVLFKVVSSKYAELSARLLSSTIKYLLLNDPCENVIYIKPKDEYLDENDKLIDKKFSSQVKNIIGKVKNFCIEPLHIGQSKIRVFEDLSYLVTRKDMNCKNDEIYLNNIEFQVFIVGKKDVKIPEKAGKLQLSKNYQATIQNLFTSKEQTNLIKTFKSKAQLFEYTEEEEVGDFNNYKVLASIKEHETNELYLYQRHLCKLASEVKFTSYGGVYYFFVENKGAWYWEKNNIGYFFVKCSVKDRSDQQPLNDMASQMSETSSVNDFASFGNKNQPKKKARQYFYLYIDYIFQSDELVDGTTLIKQNIEGKPANEVLTTKEEHLHKVVTLPCYESKIILDRYDSEGFIFNFKMNLCWKNYLKGIRSISEDQILAEYIGPFYIGVLMKDEKDIMRFVAGTFVSQHEEKTQQ